MTTKKGKKLNHRYTTSLHWILFSESITIIIIAILVFMFNHRYAGDFKKYFDYIAWVVLLFGGGKFLIEMIRHTSSDFYVTDSKVIIKTGVLNRTSVSMPLNKIESVEVDQSIWGRLLGFGTIHITGTGTATSKFDYISNPDKFRREMMKASEDSESAENDTSTTEEKAPQKRRLRRR